MGKCLKRWSEVSKSDAECECKKCGARTDDKVCVRKPKKIDKDKKEEKKGRKEALPCTEDRKRFTWNLRQPAPFIAALPCAERAR